MMRNTFNRQLSIAMIGLWLIFIALLPISLVLVFSFLQHSSTQLAIWQFTLQNYHQLLNVLFLKIVWRSLILAITVTLITLIIGYPAAFFIARAKSTTKPFLLMLMIIPFWTSSLIRTYAILAIIKVKGIVNSLLLAIGLIHQPLQILYTNSAVLIGLVYNLLPFMVLPLFNTIEKIDSRLFEAARDLGASRSAILWRVTIPLTLPGIMTGFLFVFLPAMTLFYIPDILGGAKSLLLGNLVEGQFLSINDWPGGSATSIVLTLLMLVLLWFYRRAQQQTHSREWV